MIVYHGTSVEGFHGIMKDGKIVPGFHMWAGVVRKQIYVTSNLEYAEMYAHAKFDENHHGFLLTLDMEEEDFIEYDLLLGQINIYDIDIWFYNEGRENDFFIPFFKENPIPEPEKYGYDLQLLSLFSEEEKMAEFYAIAEMEVTTTRDIPINRIKEWKRLQFY